jgi:hypothetical protein
MRIAFVAGFYDPVKEALDIPYSEHQANGSLVWIRQRELHKEADLTDVSSRFFDIAERSDSVRVILHVPRGRAWVVDSVQGILEKGKAMNSTLEFEIIPFENDGDCDGVLQCVADFGLAAPVGIESAVIRKKIPTGQVLCMSLEGQTSIVDSLQRAGFTQEAVTRCFQEDRIEGGRNSGLLQSLASKSLQYRYLVYAFDGLRTLSPAIKHKFAKCWEAPNAAKVVAQFKKWILEA